MAGNIVKITMEDTHPPVWRRVILPEKISFYDFHWVIQIVFNWDGDHLHEFSFPRVKEKVVMSDPDNIRRLYYEEEIFLDDILKTNSWIRYLYDFGDCWRHKIVFEKEVPNYNERYAAVIKWKGDSFMEDSGGVWMSQERIPFSAEAANARLAQIPFDVYAPNDLSEIFCEIMKVSKETDDLMRKRFPAGNNHKESSQGAPPYDRVRKRFPTGNNHKESSQGVPPYDRVRKCFPAGNNHKESSQGVPPYDRVKKSRAESRAFMRESTEQLEAICSSMHMKLIEWECFADKVPWLQEQEWELVRSGKKSGKKRKGGVVWNVENPVVSGKNDDESVTMNGNDTAPVHAKTRSTRGKKEPEFQQMTLPGISLPNKTTTSGKDRDSFAYELEKGKDAGSMSELLCGLNLQEAQNYAWYLQVPDREGCDRNRLAKKIALECQSHPEYLLYILDGKAYGFLLEFAKLKPGKIEGKFSADFVNRAVSLGLMDVKVIDSEEEDGRKAILSLAEDALPLLSALEKNWKKVCKRIEEIEKRVGFCVREYGVIETGEFFEVYRGYWNDFQKPEEFLRFLYWHCAMNGFLCIHLDEKSEKFYVAMTELDAASILKMQEKYAGKLSCRRLYPEELERTECGIGDWYPEWMYLAFFIARGNKKLKALYDEEMANLYVKVISGMPFTELVETLLPIAPLDTLENRVQFWTDTIDVCMMTDLAILKGYSRLDYADATGVSLFETGVFDETKLTEKIGLKTHLWELPSRIQAKIYDIFCMENEDARISDVEAVMREIGCNNVEACFLFAQHYEMEGEYDRAEQMLAHIRGRNRDESIQSLEEQISQSRALDDLVEGKYEDDGFDEEDIWMDEESWFYDQYVRQQPKQQPYRREQPKIGRNDPCPCGSGKKYKNCCGK